MRRSSDQRRRVSNDVDRYRRQEAAFAPCPGGGPVHPSRWRKDSLTFCRTAASGFSAKKSVVWIALPEVWMGPSMRGALDRCGIPTSWRSPARRSAATASCLPKMPLTPGGSGAGPGSGRGHEGYPLKIAGGVRGGNRSALRSERGASHGAVYRAADPVHRFWRFESYQAVAPIVGARGFSSSDRFGQPHFERGIGSNQGGVSGACYPCVLPSREFQFPARPRREFAWIRLESLGFAGRFRPESAEKRDIPCSFPCGRELGRKPAGCGPSFCGKPTHSSPPGRAPIAKIVLA
jgi:hypothetical protein